LRPLRVVERGHETGTSARDGISTRCKLLGSFFGQAYEQ
jgi:hypothetical protein